MLDEGTIEVFVTHAPLAFIYRLFTRTIEINGKKERRPWGRNIFHVAPGDCTVSVSYPWLFSPECGKNKVTFNLTAGMQKTVTYRAGMIRYLPGTISVQ